MFTPQQKIDCKHEPLVPLPRFKDLEVGIQSEIPQTLEATTYQQAQLTWNHSILGTTSLVPLEVPL